jgi:mediator of RNA polymerase II transcription subunit 21
MAFADSSQLLTITSASIEYITHRTQFEQTSAAIPTTLQTAQAARRKEYRGVYTWAMN